MSLQYTRTELKSRINAGIKNKQGILIDFDNVVNQAVREVNNDIDLNSTKRTSSLSPNLFNDIFDYAAPADLKGQKIVDVYPQAKRTKGDVFDLVFPEEFDRRKEFNTISIDNRDTVKTLRISARLDDQTLVAAQLNTVSGDGGTWVALTGTENVDSETFNYIKGTGGVSWDIDSSSSTTCGIKNVGLNTFDYSLYRKHSVFVWQYIPVKTNITNFILKIGQDESNYISKTITTQNDGTAFNVGWNLLRFDISDASQTGSIDTTAGAYAEVVMTKDTAKVSQAGFITDHLMFKRGEIHEVVYYSKYGWQNAAGTYLEKSTSDSDYIVCDTDEFDLFVAKGIALASLEVEEYKITEIRMADYKSKMLNYGDNNPSEAKLINSTYYNF